MIVVGAGPTGLMLAGELGQAGVRTLLLERRPVPSDSAKAGGLAGQILQLLHFRGEIDRFRGVSVGDAPAPRFPFGGLHLDFTGLDESPMRAMLLPQAQLEALLADRAGERGAEIRRGHQVVGLRQDEVVIAEVSGPDGSYEVTAGFLVGCDGGRSRVRELAGIGFPGSAFPEIERLASVTVPDSVRVLDDGSLDVRGVGRIPFGYTATERGVFACSGFDGTMGVYTAEVESTEYDDDVLMTIAELHASVGRVLGIDLPLGEPLRMTRFGYSAKQADSYRDGRVFLAGDAAHLFPAGGVAVNAGMLDAADLAWKLAAGIHGWAPPGLLDTYSEVRRAAAERTLLHTRAQVALRSAHGPTGEALRHLFGELVADEQPLLRLGALMAGTDIGSAGAVLTGRTLSVDAEDPRLAGLLGAGRSVLLDLAGRADLVEVADEWADRLEVVRISIGERPCDALLVLPDARIAWSATARELDRTALREVLTNWLGEPLPRLR